MGYSWGLASSLVATFVFRALHEERHEDNAAKADEDLETEHLSVELDEPESSGGLERLPGLQKDGATCATSLKVEVTEDKATVEGNDSLLVLRKESCLNAGQSDRRREENGQCNEDGGQRDRQQSEHPVGSVRAGKLGVHKVEASILHVLRKAKCESNSDGHNNSDLLGDSEGQSRKKDGLALLTGDHAAQPRLAAGGGDHAVSPGHVDTGKGERRKDVHECVASNSKADEAGKEVGHDGVKHVVDSTDTRSPPATEEATDAVEVADGRRDSGSDRLVVDDSNLDILVRRCLCRQHRLFLERRIRLIGILLRLGLDDGSSRGRFDHGKRSDHFTKSVADL